MTRGSYWLIAGMLLVSAALYHASRLDLALIAAENGVLEIAQVCLLAAALVFYLLSIPVRTGAKRAAAVVLALVTIDLIVRELDLRNVDVGYFLNQAMGSWRDVIFLSVGIVMTGYLIRYRRMIPEWIRQSRRPGGWYLVAAFVLFFAGYMIDKLISGSLAESFWEELVELHACIFYFAAAWRLLMQPEST